jgi:signal peptidase II
VDGAVRGTANGFLNAGANVRQLQTGRLQDYLYLTVVLLGFLFLTWPAAPRSDKVLLAGLIAAGASNVVDRLTFGGVRDFIALAPPFAWFPTFNVADLVLSVCAGLIVLRALTRPPHEQRTP